MTLLQFKPQFDNSYQEFFQKAIVSPEIMNTRFKAVLEYGSSVARVAYDISGVTVRDTNRNNVASTIDSISDSVESLLVNIEREAVFYIADGTVKQAGPLNPGEVIGGQVAVKLAADLDGKCFAQVSNALYNFDNGDLTTGTSDLTPITINATTTPQMVTRMPAKLKNKNNQNPNTNMVFVLDSYAAADLTQYIMGKNIDLAGNTFKNGYSGDVSNARLYVSEALKGQAELLSTGTFSDGDTVTINSVVFTMKTTLGATPGNVLIGAAATNSIQNLVALINAPTVTTAQGVAITSTTDLNTLASLTATATSATVMTVVGTGTGRLTVAKSATNWSWNRNFIYAYFGKKGAIDLVVQDLQEVDMRKCSDRRGTNVFSSYLAGIKTFADGAKKFLAVKILVA